MPSRSAGADCLGSKQGFAKIHTAADPAAPDWSQMLNTPLLSRPPYHVPGNDELLDLARSLENAKQADVAIEALNRIFRHVARTAVDLHCPVGNPAHHLAGEELAARSLHANVLTTVALACRLQNHRARGENLGLAVCQ